MTCVIGIRGDEGAVIAFDSFSGNDSRVMVRRDLKGAQLSPEIAFGYTWSYRYGQIIAHHLDLPDVEGDEHAWVVTAFVPAMRAALAEHGFLKKENEREESGQLVLAVRNRVFLVESDHAVCESAANYVACGSGEPYAEAAIASLQKANVELADEALATIALQTAAKLNRSVRAPWHLLRTTAVGAALKAA